MDSTRRRVPNSPQVHTISLEVIGKNSLWILIDFKWRFTHVLMLNITEMVSMVSGSRGIPYIESCLNMVSSPPVVAVAVVAISSRTIWSGTWWNTSSPKNGKIEKIIENNRSSD